MATIGNPPSNKSIFQFPPNFPSGQVSDAWMAWFQEVKANTYDYPSPVPGYALGWDNDGNIVNVPNTGADQYADLANYADPAKGAGRVGHSNALAYAANTVGKAIQDRVLSSDLADAATDTKGAALIGYLAPYTGAVGRTQQSKNGDFVSVKDFGAVGDGITDDTAALQAALSSGAKRIALRPGSTYLINGGLSGTTPALSIIAYGSTIKLKAGAGNLGMLTLSGDGSSVSGGTWDGNSANGNATGSIYNSFAVCADATGCTVRDAECLNQFGIGLKGTFRARKTLFENNRISGTTAYGIFIDGATIAGGQTSNQTHNRAKNNYIDMSNGGTFGQGILFTGVQSEYYQEYFEVSGNTVIGSQAAGMGAQGINIGVRGNRGIFANNRTKYGAMGISEGGSDTVYSGNVITDLVGTTAYGIEPSGQNCTFTGNTIRDALIGIIFSGAGITFDNCVVTGNRIASLNNAIKLQIDAATSGKNVVISGNTLTNSTGNPIIYTANNVTGLSVTGNDITGNGSATAGSRGVFLNTPSASAQVNVGGNKISAVERALGIYSATAITFTDLIAIGNNVSSDVGSSSSGWTVEGSAQIGSRVVSAYGADNGGVTKRWVDQASNVFEMWSTNYNNPNGLLSAGPGSIFHSLNANGKTWRKESGTGNTGWNCMTASSANRSTTTAAAPATTVSTAPVMMGIALAFTPGQGTGALITISGQMKNSTIGDGVAVQLRYGTGAAPANGAAVTGTQLGATQTYTATAANDGTGFSISIPVSGLTTGTAYWIDAAVNAVTGGTASITGISVSAVEI